MTKALYALAGAAVVLTGVPADARHYSNVLACSGWRNGTCVAWNRLTVKQARKIGVGYVFPQGYSYYTEYSALPPAIVTQYHFSPNYHYVSVGGHVYVVDPTTSAVTQVITVP